ncbi:MAG: hypothetical protein JNM82_04490, partial [Rhodocyclaceae bacterium]|nr:hypothetical protein [Rhodocyclaceae bacterium]
MQQPAMNAGSPLAAAAADAPGPSWVARAGSLRLTLAVLPLLAAGVLLA